MQELIDSNKYQVFIYGSKAHLPFIFACHSWVVLNKKGSISRWEVVFRKNKSNDKSGNDENCGKAFDPKQKSDSENKSNHP